MALQASLMSRRRLAGVEHGSFLQSRVNSPRLLLLLTRCAYVRDPVGTNSMSRFFSPNTWSLSNSAMSPRLPTKRRASVSCGDVTRRAPPENVVAIECVAPAVVVLTELLTRGVPPLENDGDNFDLKPRRPSSDEGER